MDKIASERDKWIKRNKYYYKNLIELFRFIIPEGSNVLEGVGRQVCSVSSLPQEMRHRGGQERLLFCEGEPRRQVILAGLRQALLPGHGPNREEASLSFCTRLELPVHKHCGVQS